jgi:hypothetical protein
MNTDCAVHSKTIETLQTQIAALETSLARTENARLVLFYFLLAVDEAIRNQRSDTTTRMLFTWLTRASRKVHAAHTLAWAPVCKPSEGETCPRP